MTKFYSKSVGGFVDPAIFGAAMPDDAIEISDEHYTALLASQKGGGIAHDDSGNLVAVDPMAALTLDQIKDRKLAELAGDFADRIASVKAGYPADEVSSWPEQKAEASAYSANSTAATPLLAAMATARGITVADLAGRVLANAQAWSAASGQLIGKRQAYEDAVGVAYAAKDAAAIAVISWVD